MHWPSSRGAGGGQPAAAGGGAAAAALGKGGGGGDQQTGFFDPIELERGATALKEIDESKHSAWAFELAAMQEKTGQLTHLLEVEKQKTNRSHLEQALHQAGGDEQRRTISHTADQERETAQYKAQIEAQLQGRKLEFQREQLEYQLRRENDQFAQHEGIRVYNDKQMEEAARETMRIKAKFDRETAMADARAVSEGMAKQERENIEIRLRELRAQSAEDRRTRLDSIEEVFANVNAGAKVLYEDPAKSVTAIAGLTALALGVYGARAGVKVASAVLERNLGRPPLVRETSRWSWRPQLMQWPWSSKERPKIFESIVLEDTLAERLQWSTNALVSAQENGTPFRHLLLHGKPGTGKTLFARTLARQSGLDYAIMSGGDLGPLGREGPSELHKLFNWASRSRRGLVLFIDEADAFLRRGRGGDTSMSEDARNCLSVFLHHTGTESARVAVILATNIPSALDRAVLDRMDEAFEFPIPQYEQRMQMLRMFVDRYLNQPFRRGRKIEVDPAVEDPEYFAAIAKRTEGMSGRQLAKLVLAFQSAVFGSGTMRLTHGLAETVLQWRLANPNA